MHPVEMKNESGWPIRALQELRTFEGVQRVDGIGVRADGSFDRMVVYLPTAAMAANFAGSAAQALRAYRG